MSILAVFLEKKPWRTATWSWSVEHTLFMKGLWTLTEQLRLFQELFQGNVLEKNPEDGSCWIWKPGERLRVILGNITAQYCPAARGLLVQRLKCCGCWCTDWRPAHTAYQSVSAETWFWTDGNRSDLLEPASSVWELFPTWIITLNVTVNHWLNTDFGI